MNGFAGTECADRTVTRPWRSGPSRVTGIGEAKPHRKAFPGGRQVQGKTRLVDRSAGQTAPGALRRQPTSRPIGVVSRPETGVYPLTAMCFVPSWPSRCKSISMTFCAKQTSRRNGRNCCAISTGCRMCVSSIGGPIGWCARTRPETSRLCSVTLISGCHRVPGKPRLRRLHHRHRPTNAAVAQSVVPRRLEFRRNSHEIRDLQKLTVQVGQEVDGNSICRIVYKLYKLILLSWALDFDHRNLAEDSKSLAQFGCHRNGRPGDWPYHGPKMGVIQILYANDFNWLGYKTGPRV